MKWMRPVSFGLISIICLMPALGSWAWIFLVLGFLLFFKPGKGWLCANGLGGWEFGLLGLIFGISAAFSTGMAPGRTGFRPETFLETESWILMAWLVSRWIPRQLAMKILRFLVLSSLVWIFLGFQQLALGVPTNPGWLSGAQSKLIPVRIFSVFINPNIYAVYLLAIFVLALEFITSNRELSPKCGLSSQLGLSPDCVLDPNPGIKVIYGVIAGVALLSLYFTYSRMAWVLAGVFGFSRLIRYFKWRGFITSAAVVLGLLAIPAFRLRLGDLIYLTDSSLHYRIRIWQGVIRALGTFWLWGAGPGSFGAVYPIYQLGNTPAQHAHQIYLQIWLEYGIFALGGFIFLMIRLLQKPKFLGLGTVLLIFLGYGFSETWYLNHDLGVFFWLFAGLLGTAPGCVQKRPVLSAVEKEN